MSSNQLLHIIPNANRGGIEKDLYYILSEENGAYTHMVWVLGSEGPMSAVWGEKGAEVIHLNILHLSPIKFQRALRKRALNWQGSGILCWSPTRLPLVRGAFLRYHGKMMVHMGNPVSPSLKTQVFQLLSRHFSSVVFDTRLFCCSNHVKESANRDRYFGLFSSVVSYNPVLIPASNSYTEEQWLSSTIGMVARMDRIKDFDTVILAMKELREINLELGGDGPERNRLEQLAKTEGLSNTTFLGFVDNVYEKLNSWKLFVYGTTMEEGLGNVVIEAMANGLPCVLPDLPMMREIAGNTALYYVQGNEQDCAKQTQELIGNKTLALELSSEAYKRAKEKFHPRIYYQDRIGYLTQK